MNLKIQKKRPPWLKVNIKETRNYKQVRELISQNDLNTVCKEAGCPNIYECFSAKTATFLILGDKCTRNCGFCLVKNGKPHEVDLSEPGRILSTVKKMNLKYVVITSVTRDDLEDGGAGIFAETVRMLKDEIKGIKVEVLIPDFKGNETSLRNVIDACPDIINHNMETVERLYSEIRKGADYYRSLRLISNIKKYGNDRIFSKSGLVIGMGEKWNEIIKTIEDLKNSDCDILTIGQYLSPSKNHLPVQKYYTPEEFDELKSIAHGMSFKFVVSSPLTRSSYHAHEVFNPLQTFHSQHDLHED